MSLDLDTLEWIVLALILGPWAIIAAWIFRARTMGQYGEERAAMAQELRQSRQALHVAHERELALYQSNVDALKSLIREREQNATLKRERSA